MVLMKTEKATAIIPARGGSKGLPGKNIKPFCGKPLIAWSIEQAQNSAHVDSVWVTSDSEEILQVAEQHGAFGIKRPAEISGDTASSESAWLHAIDAISTCTGKEPSLILAMQATSPLRDSRDIDLAVEQFHRENLDSLLSGDPLEIFFIWSRQRDGHWMSSNFDYRQRPRRQEIPTQAHENGSFYLFRSHVLRTSGNRLHGRIGLYEMAKWKGFEIDTLDEFEFCEMVYRHYRSDRAIN